MVHGIQQTWSTAKLWPIDVSHCHICLYSLRIAEMWVHNNCSFMSDSEYETMQNSNCTWICPKCDFFNFSDSFFNEQFNLESENRFDLLARGHETKSTETLNSKNSLLVV